MVLIVRKFFVWYFLKAPKEIIKVWFNYFRFVFNYFSVSTLIKTFFSHWKQYRWTYGRGFDFARYLETFFSNLISRFLGMAMRSILIVVAFVIELMVFFSGIITLFGWFLFPFVFVIVIGYLLVIIWKK